MTSFILLCCLALAVDGTQSPASSQPPGPAPADVVASIEAVVADAIAKAEPSVVAIHRLKSENGQETLAVRGRRPPPVLSEPNRFDGRFRLPMDTEDFLSFDYGSGVVIGDRGQILTAFHVVRGAARLGVRAAGRQSFDAEVIAADPRSDLAVIAPRLSRGGEPPHLKPLAIGDASRLRKGSFLIALGNPFNAARDGSPSASWGILSNRARRLEPDVDGDNVVRRAPRLPNYPTLLQLDAKLNLGMSGGAVIDLRGELVGITTTAASPAGFDSQAGYATPMDKLGRRVVETLKEGKEVEYGLLGIHADLNKTNRVGEVQINSPAALGHLQVHDEIIAVNDVPVNDFDSLILAINAYPAGDAVQLKVRRGDDLIERTVVLAKFPVEGEIIATNRPPAWRGLRVDYMTALNYRTFGFQFDRPVVGVVVTEVEDGSPAASAGLKKGQSIQRAGDRPVLTPRAFAQAVAGLDGPVILETDLGPVTVGK
jgi:S1-C subfamily serine protease